MENKVYSHFTFVCAFLRILRSASTTTEACAYFQFPTLHSRKIIFAENSFVNFTFILNVMTCRSNFNNVDIHVEVNSSRRCHIQLKDRKCSVAVAKSLCSCVSASGPFMFTKDLDRSDNALWTWSAYDDHLQLIADVNVSFIIMYPPRVTSLTVNEHVNPQTLHVIRKQNVHVVCTWEEGNPPVDAYILDRNRNILANKYNDNGSIYHTYRAIGCHDAGVISCEARSSERNLTTQLLVECPADFGNNSLQKLTVSFGHNVQVRLPVRMHSANITSCQITKHVQKYNDEEMMLRPVNVNYECLTHASGRITSRASKTLREKCWCFVNGTEPDLTLNVEIFDVTKQDSGRWTVTLTNQVGTSYTDFFVDVTEVPPRVTSLTVNGHYGQDPLLVIRKQSVKVICAWENGNPPDRIRILDREDKVLQSASYNNGTMHYDFPAVDCNDAGVIRCEADSSTRNMSATLLVECPPDFVYNSPETFTLNEDNHFLHFPIRAHTADITECQISRRSDDLKINGNTYLTLSCGITKLKPIQSLRSLTDKCVCTVNGTAPDLNLYIRLFHVKENDRGIWQLTLTNEVGVGRTFFTLYVKADEHKNGVGSTETAVIAGCITAVTIIIIIIITVIALIKRGKIVYEQPKRTRQEEMAAYQCPVLDVDRTASSQTNIPHIYEEIQENEVEIANTARKKSVHIGEARRNDLNTIKMELDTSYEIESLQPCNMSTSSHSSGSDKPNYLKPI